MNRLIVLVLLLLPACLLASMADDLQVHEPYVRENPPARDTTAAYMALENTGQENIVITAVDSNIADDAAIHNTLIHDNMMHMEHLETVSIPPASTLTLSPMGMHIMLTDLKHDLKAGESITLTLHFQDQSQTLLTLPVYDYQ